MLPEMPFVRFVCPIPAPCNVIALVPRSSVEVHVQLPGGTVTVSPLDAAVTAVPTSALEQDAAVTVAATPAAGKRSRQVEKTVNRKAVSTISI
jgi:hypothetical protein